MGVRLYKVSGWCFFQGSGCGVGVTQGLLQAPWPRHLTAWSSQPRGDRLESALTEAVASRVEKAVLLVAPIFDLLRGKLPLPRRCAPLLPCSLTQRLSGSQPFFLPRVWR